MLVEKEIIGPATHWYVDEQTGLPKKLVVTSDLTKYWRDQGNAMLAANLTVPVPYEHDFQAHPMTPKDKLLNNAGWVKEYRLRDVGKRKDVLYGIVDVCDDEATRKMNNGSIKWTSPWISSFTDGQGRDWKNVISHLALTTRPRIVEQESFTSIAAALSIASQLTTGSDIPLAKLGGDKGFCLSKAGRLYTSTKTRTLRPRYPMAFSMWGGGIKLAAEDMPPKKKGKGTPPPQAEDELDDLPPEEMEGSPGTGGPPAPGGMGVGGPQGGVPGEMPPGMDPMGGMMNPLADAGGDVQMEELLCDLLNVLGVPMPETSSEPEFKRHLYEAAMIKIQELAQKGQAQPPPGANPLAGTNPAATRPNTRSPAGQQQQNPLIQQEAQPMYMSLEEINKLDEPLRGVALSMYAENQKLRTELDANAKATASLRDKTLAEASAKRIQRVQVLGLRSPKSKPDLDAMLALPSMALSMGDGGVVVDPMAAVLGLLEKSLADLPMLLTADRAALAIQPHPTDSEMTEEKSDAIADRMADMMGAPPRGNRKAG